MAPSLAFCRERAILGEGLALRDNIGLGVFGGMSRFLVARLSPADRCAGETKEPPSTFAGLAPDTPTNGGVSCLPLEETIFGGLSDCRS